MVQVLPYVPSFLEQLNPAIKQATGDISGFLQNRAAQKNDQSILAQLQSGSVSPVNYPTLWSKLSPEARKTYEPFLQSALRSQETANKENVKRETVDLEKQEKAESILASTKQMRDLIEYTGTQSNPFYRKSFGSQTYGFNREGLEKREEFDTLAAQAASFFRDLETKGQLPLGLYEKVIEPRLPNSKLSERQNLGRINAIESLARRYGKLESKGAEKSVKEEKKSSGSVKLIAPNGEIVELSPEQAEEALKRNTGWKKS